MKYRTELMDEILTSPTAQRYIDFIAPVYGNGYVALWMFQTIGLALDDLTQFADGLGDQMAPQTADWSIPDWEAEYGILPDSSLTIEQRRANILMRMRFVAPANPYRLAQYASAASGVPCEIVENIGKNTFAVVMRAYGGDIANMEAVLDTAKPAHLIYIYYVSMLREAESRIYSAVAGSYHKRYPNVELDLWNRAAESRITIGAAGTIHRQYPAVELGLYARSAEAHVHSNVTFSRYKHYGEIEVTQ